MARTGGTVISRCLGAMKNVVLLSEIHPMGVQLYNPLKQAADWYQLLTGEDRQHLRTNQTSFVDAIALIAERCEQRNCTLVLRDWSHLDFTGVPFTKPNYKSRLASALEEHFELIRFATVRHPLDQWLSVTRQEVIRQKLELRDYLAGCEQFAHLAMDLGYVRYEDFTRNPEDALKTICEGLDMDFDPGYAQRWQHNKKITGDVVPGRAQGQTIKTLPRQEVTQSLLQAMADNTDYEQVLSALGYQHHTE